MRRERDASGDNAARVFPFPTKEPPDESSPAFVDAGSQRRNRVGQRIERQCVQPVRRLRLRAELRLRGRLRAELRLCSPQLLRPLWLRPLLQAEMRPAGQDPRSYRRPQGS